MTGTRKLAAIMFTDIVGYTALMGKNESHAFRLLEKNRQIQRPVIEEYHGKWIKELGDGVMSSFNTVSDAVNAAMRIQELCRKENKFQLRIGIHSGEVVFDNDDVFGDGVNIASRIQAIAEPGTVFVSETIFHNISNKNFEVIFIKEERLKNVKEPVKIYKVKLQGTGEEKPASTNVITEKSIAVLPFVNMSNDPEQEYFSDGITEEIITDLSHLHDLLVVSRSSVMTFKGQLKNTKEIARELGVNYILEGSVRKAANQLRITAQLIDATRDVHLWAEKYNGLIDDVFNIQEKVSRSIADSLRIRLTPNESKQISEKPIDNIFAYECYLKARGEIIKWNKDSFDKAKKYIEDGLSANGPNALLYGTLAYTYWSYANMGFDSLANYNLAKAYIDKTLELEKESPVAHLVLGNLYWTHYGNLLQSFPHYCKVLETVHNDFDATMWLSLCYSLVGLPAIAAELGSRLKKIDPLNPISELAPICVNFYDGRFEKAANDVIAVYNREPENPFFRLTMILLRVYNNEVDSVIDFIKKNIQPDAVDIIEQTTYMFKTAFEKDTNALNAWLSNNTIHRLMGRDCQYSHILSVICAIAGLKTESLTWLDTAIEDGYINYPFLSDKDHILHGLFKGDPEHLALIEKAKNRWENFKPVAEELSHSFSK